MCAQPSEGASPARPQPASAGSGAASRSRRVGGLVLIDPIACLLHQSRVTNQFVYTPASCLKEASDDFYFKKELFTATVHCPRVLSSYPVV